MFASMLQYLGFGRDKPLHSPPAETAPPRPADVAPKRPARQRVKSAQAAKMLTPCTAQPMPEKKSTVKSAPAAAKSAPARAPKSKAAAEPSAAVHPAPKPAKAKASAASPAKPIEQWQDADVLAMPEADYMNEAQLAFFRLKLERQKNEILSNAGQTTEHLREDTVVVPDPADRATIEEEHALELRTRDRERKLLKKIEQSIDRVDSGEYGYCEETGEPIGLARLLARPTASLSLEAQQRRELKQKMFGD